MNAIKPSWTRSPQPFAIKLEPSAAHQWAFAVFVIAICTQLLFSPLSLAALLPCFVILAIAAWSQWRKLQQTPLQVLCYSPTGTWSIHTGTDSFYGQLGKQSYRSRRFCIVAIERDDCNTRYIPVFYDSVDRCHYSLLQMHLKFPV